MKLIAYPVVANPPEIRPAESTRPWLEKIPKKYGYRCLPLTVANAHGWEILCPTGFTVTWDGQHRKEGMRIEMDGDAGWRPDSHFGSGVLTFHVGYLFRTEKDVNLSVGGPPNRAKDGIGPLSGIVETDWSPYSFTMNWQMTRANLPVRFEAGEPFCFLSPVQRGLIDAQEPEIRTMSEDPALVARHKEWLDSRGQFIEDLRKPGSEAASQRWQKNYYLGEFRDGAPGPEDHQIKLTVRPFADKRPPDK